MVAHEDDSILFQTPDLQRDISNGICTRTVFVTAGDAGGPSSYWLAREAGARAAYAQMAGVPDSWTQSDAGVPGHPVPVFTLDGNSNVSVAFMRLPDGNSDGSGFATYGNESLQSLWFGSQTTLTADDGTSSYTRSDLISTLAALMSASAPSYVGSQDYVGPLGDGDHSDHHVSALFVQAASLQYTNPHMLNGYRGYPISLLPVNLSASESQAKQTTYYTYCNTVGTCSPSYSSWWEREYSRGLQYSGLAPSSGAPGASITLRGSGFAGATGVTFGGVSAPYAIDSDTQITATVPAGARSGPVVVTVPAGAAKGPAPFVVTGPSGSNVAPVATVTASTQAVFAEEFATSAVDGYTDGCCTGDPTHEWATNGEQAGAWLNLAWATPQTLSSVVLYDRPNPSDQVLAGTLSFSNGTQVPVGALSNDGSPVTVSFSARTVSWMRFTVTQTSAATVNIGLAEIEAWTSAGPPPPPPPPPANTVLPVISGSAQQGQTLTVSNGSWTNSPSSYSYQWQRCTSSCSPISGATSSSYTAQAADLGDTLKATVTASNNGGSGSATSNPTAAVQSAGSSGSNVAGQATVTASSENASTQQLAVKAVDGFTDGCCSGNYTHEWATIWQQAGAWLNLAWATPQTLSSVVLYDRPNPSDQVLAGTLSFSNGTQVPVGALSNDGSPVTVSFSARTVSWMRFTVTQTSAATVNIGLAEIEAWTSAGPPPPPPPPPPANTVLPVISGSAQQGQTLTVSNGSWTNSPSSYSYQWQRCTSSCSPISGATSSSYTAQAADLGDTLKATVTASNNGGSGSATSNPTTAVQPATTPPPANTVLPVISGSAQQGQTLTVSNGSWTNSPSSYSYQWQRCTSSCSPISGATSSSYTAQAADLGDTLKATVTASNNGGSGSATSNPTAAVQSAGSSGSNVAGQATVTASSENASTQQLAVKAVDGFTDGCCSGNYTHEWATIWQQAGAWLNLAWATPQTLSSVVLYDRPNPSDQVLAGTLSFSNGTQVPVGALSNDGSPVTVSFSARTVSWMRFTVTQTSAATVNIGLAEIEAWTSAGPPPPPPPPPPANTVLPVISGSAQQGQTLTVSNGSWTNSPSSYSYQWQRCTSSCSPISGATSSSYTAQAADLGDTLKATVTASNNGGSGSATSNPTTAVQPATTTATFGTTTIGANSDPMLANRKRVNHYQLTQPGTISNLSVYLEPTGTSGSQTIQGIIYTDNTGSPGTLLATSTELTFSSTQQAGWYDLTFATPITLPTGTYWIGVITGNTSYIAAFRYSTATNSRAYNVNPYTNGPSTTFGTPTTDNEQMSIYATYTPS